MQRFVFLASGAFSTGIHAGDDEEKKKTAGRAHTPCGLDFFFCMFFLTVSSCFCFSVSFFFLLFNILCVPFFFVCLCGYIYICAGGLVGEWAGFLLLFFSLFSLALSLFLSKAPRLRPNSAAEQKLSAIFFVLSHEVFKHGFL